MMHRQERVKRRAARGQGLVEYALTIALVGLVSIAALFSFGLLVQRTLGVLAGSMGGRVNDTSGAVTIEITRAECQVDYYFDWLGYWIEGNTNVDPASLTLRTNFGDGVNRAGQLLLLEPNGPGRFKLERLETGVPVDPGNCPTGIAIQAPDGSLAVSPMITRVFTSAP
jgi:hypothetical protein